MTWPSVRVYSRLMYTVLLIILVIYISRRVSLSSRELRLRIGAAADVPNATPPPAPPTAAARRPTVQATTMQPCARGLFSSRADVSALRAAVYSHGDFPRTLNRSEQAQLMAFVNLTVAELRRRQLTYMLDGPSLLGSYMMHGMLPMEDTVHLAMRASDYSQLQAIESSSGVTFLDRTHSYVKLYATAGRPADAWRWPFIDVRLYSEDENNVWFGDGANGAKRFKVPPHIVYPLHDRPFGSQWLPAPRHAHTWLLAQYKPESGYREPAWDSRLERRRKTKRATNWKILSSRYPVVKRVRCGTGTKEAVWSQGVEQYNVYIDEPCTHTQPVYGL